MIQCPECRSHIPDDSHYCDQCGKELHWCPECKKPKRGTQCPVCGNDLIPSAKYYGTTQATQQAKPQPTLQHAVSPTESPVVPPSQCQASSFSCTSSPQGTAVASNITRLVGNGLVLNLMEGSFGRTKGMWPQLSSFQYISGNHGRISHIGSDWAITDVGSTNGTFLNGQLLIPNVATVIHRGDCVRIATYDFIIE